MKRDLCILILIAAAFFLACAPRPIPPPQPIKYHPGNALISKAEKMFQQKAYGNALALYREYLSQFPDGYLATEALMKTGLIQSALGKNKTARNTYNRLIAEYPSSLLALDARVEILRTLIHEARYKPAIHYAAEILKQIHSREYMLKTYTLLGDAYLAGGAPKDALKSYVTAYKKAEAEEKEGLILKIESAAKETDPNVVFQIIQPIGNTLPLNDFLYQMGIKNLEWKKYEDAVIMLSAFIKKFPDDENVSHAKDLIKEINEKFTFKHNTLGCLLPLSGPYQAYGDKILKCIELALTQFNSHHLDPIHLIVKDTESDADKAVQAVRELSEDRVGAIIGPVAFHKPAALEAQEKRIPIITLSQKENITDIGDYVFRNFITPKMQVETIVSYAINGLELNRFAVLYPDDRYGRFLMDLFKDETMDWGGEVVRAIPYNPDQTDFAEPIKKLAKPPTETTESTEEKEPGNNLEDDKPVIDFDALFIPDGPKTSGLIIPQLAYYDIVGIQLLGTNLWHSHRLIEMAQQFVQGAIMVDGFFPESQSEKVTNFVENFEETFDQKPGFIEAVSYDTAMMLFNLVSRNDIQSRNQLKDEILNLRSFQGVTGETSFDEDGNAQKKLYLLQIQGDKFVEIENN